MLLSLPNEIIHSICSLFCAHCCDLEGFPLNWRFVDFDNIVYHRHQQNAFTLLRVVQTCTKLRNIAQPILYHAPTFYSYTRLACTLLTRPDLASAVRVYSYLLRVREYGPKYPSFAVYEDMQFILETARAREVVEANAGISNVIFINADNRETTQPVLPMEAPVRRPRYADYIHVQMEWFDKLAEQTILSLLPNLEAVVLRVNDRPNHPHATEIPGYHFARVFPHPNHVWPFLHTLAIEHISPTRDPTGPYMIRHYQSLLEKAPNLQRLVLSNLVQPKELQQSPELSLPLPFLDSVRQLVLHGVIDGSTGGPWEPLPQTSCIREIMALFSNLESVIVRPRHHAIDALEGGFPSNFSPARHLQDLPTKTLRHLALHSSYTKIRQDVTLAGLGSLEDFGALTSLVIDEQCFCKHWLQDKAPIFTYEGEYIPPSTATCLTSILPSQVTNLTVRLHDKYYAVDDILELGKQVASGRFPALSRLFVMVVDEVKRKQRYTYVYDTILDHQKRHQFLETVEEKQDYLQARTLEWRQEILAAFAGSMVNVVVERVVEDVFSMVPTRELEHSFYVPPESTD